MDIITDGCGAAPREDFTVERAESGGYSIEAHIPGAHRLFWSAWPQGFCDDNDLGEFAGSIQVADPLPDARCYFHIMTGHRYSVAATRALRLSGLDNFRELGGYNTADGAAFVKHGLLLRSDRLYGVDERGVRRLRRMGVRTVLDFRVAAETEKRGDPELPGASYYNLCPIPPDDAIFKNTLAETVEMGVDALWAHSELLKAQYRRLPFCTATYAKMFELLLEGRAPMLFHCTAGKDRTGVAALLILLALGVPRETAVYDYMLTASVRSRVINERMEEFRPCAQDERGAYALTTFFSVHRESIEGALEAIDESCGGDIDGYFLREMKLGPAERSRLRTMYLTKHIEKDGAEP